MAVTISLVLILGVAVLTAMRFRALPFGTGLLAILFGISLAPTGTGDALSDGMAAIATNLANISF